MTNSFYYNGSRYVPRSEADQWTGFALASVTSWGAYKMLPHFAKPSLTQIKKEERNNASYKKAMEDAFEKSGLKNLGVKIEPAQYDMYVSDYSSGRNACYEPMARKIKLNTDKASALSFHEMGHAVNHLMTKHGKVLQKLRIPGAYIAGLMEWFAVFSRTKPKEAQRNPKDWIEDNCGKIAFLSLMPVVAEEALASHNGIKLAKSANLSKPLINNLKKLYSRALLTYGARAVIGGLAVFASRKIMDYYTFPQKVDDPIYELFG